MWHDTVSAHTVSNPSRTYRDYRTNEGEGAHHTYKTTFRSNVPKHNWLFTTDYKCLCFIHFRKSRDRKRLPFLRSGERSECRSRTASSCLPVSDVSGKVWSTLITTQQEGIYPKGSLLTPYLNVQIATCCTLATALSGAGCALQLVRKL